MTRPRIQRGDLLLVADAIRAAVWSGLALAGLVVVAAAIEVARLVSADVDVGAEL